MGTLPWLRDKSTVSTFFWVPMLPGLRIKTFLMFLIDIRNLHHIFAALSMYKHVKLVSAHFKNS